MFMRLKTDMELKQLYSLPVNFHSRTRLPSFSHIPGGITPAAVRLQGGKGNVQLDTKWMNYCSLINNHNAVSLKYIFHKDSGWQNSATKGRVEELGFQGNKVEVLKTIGNRAYLKTFFLNEEPPKVKDLNDPRIQKFTIVTKEDKLEGSPKGNVYTFLIARRGEELWIPIEYLAPITEGPIVKPKKAIKEIIVYSDFTTKQTTL